jgi:hypothetical protein
MKPAYPGFLAIALVAVLCGCSRSEPPSGSGTPTVPKREIRMAEPQRPDRVAGEYLVTAAEETTVEELRSLFAEFRPDKIQDRGNGLWLVHLATDPGLERLQELAKGSSSIRAIQPNFRYYTQPSPPQE